MFKTSDSKFLMMILLVCAALVGYGQEVSYKEMMQDNQYNYYEVVKAADLYFETHGTGKGSGFKGYNRWKAENESKYAPSGDRSNVDPYLVDKAYKEIVLESNIKNKKGSFDDGWLELGPWDANNVTSHYSPGIGRVETFWVNPQDDKHIFLGSRSGGFWRTTDGGQNWENTTDFLVASGVPALGVNPANVKEVLISVEHGGAGYTHGVYRSLDGGATWLESNFNPVSLTWGGLGDNEHIYKIAYHPTTADKVFVCSTQGLYVSDDNLKTWNRVFTGRTTDVAFHPTNSDVIYAYRNSGNDRNYLKKSTNGGATFSNAGEFIDNSNARIYLSTSPAEPNHIYAASTNNVYKSLNSGIFFVKLDNPDESCFGFAVSDTDVKNMIYGYVDLHASTNGGTTFTQKTKWATQDDAYIHADLRVAGAVNGVFYVGTDGYLAKSSDNGNTWTTLNDGTAIREFYAVGLSQGDYDMNIVGSQDNGTSILNADGWVEWNGGDGMEALVHPLNSDWMIGSWQFGTRNYTRNGGLTRTGAGNPDGGSEHAFWEAPMLVNPLNAMQIWHFSSRWYKGDNFGTDWVETSSPNIGQIKEAAVSELDSNVVVIARDNNIRLTTDGGETWSNIASGLPGYFVTDIAMDPMDDNTIALTYNRYQDDDRKIFISYDQGKTWNNITYNLDKMPLRTVIIDYSDSSYIYVGGEIGVYYKSKNATQWTLYNNKMPNVTVKDLEIHYGSNTLRAATWGRGLWEYTLVDRNDYPSITHTQTSNTPSEYSPKATIGQHVTSRILYDGTISSVKLKWSSGNNSLDNEIKMVLDSDDMWISEEPIGENNEGAMVYFQVVAKGSSNDISQTAVFNYSVKEAKYCEGSGANGTGSDYISKVTLGDYSNSSNQDYYGDFTDDVISLLTNKNYTLEVELRSHFIGDSVTAWIDYNGDFEFSEEEQIIFSTFNTNHQVTGDFTVPNDAVIDRNVRMRVRSQYFSQQMSPCDNLVGEVEDYTIEIDEGVSSIKELTVLEGEILPNPNNGIFEVAFSKILLEPEVIIYDLQGKVVFQNQIEDANHLKVETQLSAGVYTILVNSGSSSFGGKLIVK